MIDVLTANILDLSALRCALLSRRLEMHVKPQRLSGWAEGVEVFPGRNVLFVPEYTLQVCEGIVPLEAIRYEFPPVLAVARRCPRRCHD